LIVIVTLIVLYEQSEKSAAGKAEVLKQLQDAVDSVTAAKVTVEKMKLSDLPQLLTAAADFDKLLKEAKVRVLHNTLKLHLVC
jgi:hypothetical protein